MKWDGAAWSDADLRKWNGTSWVTTDMYYWSGTAWVLMTDRTPPTTTHNDTYNSTWWDTYQDNNTRSGNGHNYQGYYDGVWGIQKSNYGFDYATISGNVHGRVGVYAAQVYLSSLHFYYSTGGYAVIGTHTNTSDPSTFSYNRYNNPGTFAWGRTEAKWVSVTTDIIQWFDEQSARGITLYANTTDSTYYGYFNTSASLYMSYEK
jgi:hypothetical protein